MARRYEDDDERTYTDVVNYLRQAEPEQYEAFKQFFSEMKNGERKKIIGLPGIMRALEDSEPGALPLMDSVNSDENETDTPQEATGTYLHNGKS